MSVLISFSWCKQITQPLSLGGAATNRNPVAEEASKEADMGSNKKPRQGRGIARAAGVVEEQENSTKIVRAAVPASKAKKTSRR